MESRRTAYALLAELLRHGLTAGTRDVVAALPELSAGVYEDLDAAGAAHQRVFGREVLPFQGVFLEPTATCGGAEQARLLDDMLAAGLAPVAEAEHVSALLEAIADAEAPDALLGHLLRWLPPFAVAVERLGEPLSSAVLAQLVAVAAHHAEALGLTAERLPEAPGLGAVLDRPETDLRRIAAHLLTPVASGWWLTLADLSALGRSVGVPMGFGRRVQRLETLLHGAANHGQLASLVDGLQAIAGDWRRRYEGLSLASDGWIDRLEGTRSALGRLAG